MSLRRPILISIILAGIFLAGFTSLTTLVYLKLRDVKEPLLEALEKYIEGDLKVASAEVSLFPAGIQLTGVELYAPQEKEPAALIPEARLSFKLIPLIQKKIETRLSIKDPVIRLHAPKQGRSNMEEIFSPLINQQKPEATPMDKLWWRRLVIEELTITNAHFISTKSGDSNKTEMENINIHADHIRFESDRVPAEITISYEMPRVSKAPLELFTKMRFSEKDQAMNLEEGRIQWGPLKIKLAGQAKLPAGKAKDVTLDLTFASQGISLEELSKVFRNSPRATGTLAIQGKVTGTVFNPQLFLTLNSPSLQFGKNRLNKFHAEISKTGQPIQIKNASFGIYGGTIEASGALLPQQQTSADLQVKLKGLSVAAMSGKQEMPARLSGQLKLKSPAIENMNAYHGGGGIVVGPIPLPTVNLKNKIRLAEILAAGTGINRMVNVGLLENSQNVIGTQVDQVKAQVSIANGNLTLRPFSLGNGKFSASGDGKILKQKNVSANGTFTLSRGVTRQLILDPQLRTMMTDGKGTLSFPFSVKGPLADPQVSVDSSGLKKKTALATAMLLQRQALGQVDTRQMLNSALKDTPLGDPKNPLSQVLGTTQPTQNRRATRTQSNTRTQSTTQRTQPKTQPKLSTGNSLADQLLFGN